MGINVPDNCCATYREYFLLKTRSNGTGRSNVFKNEKENKRLGE